MGQLSGIGTSADCQLTSHAMLIPWGLFAQDVGLIKGIQTVPIPQRTRDHTPQAKLLEFFVAILKGSAYVQDISCGPNPLDQDPAVARACCQEGWADYSGVSRMLKVCQRIPSKPWWPFLPGSAVALSIKKSCWPCAIARF